MANIGMQYAAFAPISAETAGSAITYGTGVHIEHARSCTINFNRSNDSLYGDDKLVELDKSLTSYELTFEATELNNAELVALLGEVAASTTGSPQIVTDATGPYGGFGFVQVKRVNGETSAEGYWFYKLSFGMNEMSATTRGENIEWGTPTIVGTGMGTNQDSAGTISYYEHQHFTTVSAAIAYIKGKAGIT